MRTEGAERGDLNAKAVKFKKFAPFFVVRLCLAPFNPISPSSHSNPPNQGSMGPLLLLIIPLLLLQIPFTSSSPSTSDLTPISRFLLSLPSNFPNPGPFQDTSPEDSDVISMNKKLAKSEGGISGLVSKAVKSGGRGAR